MEAAVISAAFAPLARCAAGRKRPMRRELVGAMACRTRRQMVVALGEFFERVGVLPLLPAEIREATRVDGNVPSEH
jgi:hypothetical protein